LLAGIVAGSVLAVGAVHLPVLVAVAVLAFAAAELAIRARGVRRPAPPTAFALALSGCTLLQVVPLPVSVIELVARGNADVWSRALMPLGEAGPRLATLSLDPGATLVEALKWAVYAAVAEVAFVVSERRGEVFGAATVFGSAVAAACLTVLHGLAGVTRVYGLYEPTFAVLPWHVGPLLNTNNLAGYLDLGIFCGTGLLLMHRPVALRWLIAVGIAVAVAVGVTSGSRAGIALLFGGVLVLGVLLRRRSSRHGHRDEHTPPTLRWLVAAAIVGGSGLALLGGTRAVWAELYDRNLSKLEMVGWVKPMVLDHPWVGIGRGAFESVFPAYRTARPSNTVYTHIENFPMQWVSEWGLPVGLAALVAFAWLLRPSRLGVRRSALATGTWVGLAVLVVQNLVDLAFEIPAVMIALFVVLGSLWGDRARSGGALVEREHAVRRRRARRSDVRPSEPARLAHASRRGVAVALVCAVGAALLGAAVAFGWHDVSGDRVALQALVAHAGRAGLAPGGAVRPAVRAAMLRHPAEPYFPLVAALAAFSGRTEDPMPWLQRSLERGQVNGRAHLLLAEVLASRGARRQALFELRLTAEYDPVLVGLAARTAVGWTRDHDDLVAAVPDGALGAPTLAAMIAELARPDDRAVREQLALDAIAREPSLTGPHIILARGLVDDLVASPRPDRCADRAVCERALEAHLAAIDACNPGSSQSLRLRSTLLRAGGKSIEAEHLLAEGCETVVDRVACLQERVTAAAESKGAPQLEPAVKQYLAAACALPTVCAESSTWLGMLMIGRGEWGAAATHFARAVRDEPTVERWTHLAEAESHLGAHAKAAEAFTHAFQKGGSHDAALKKRADDERAQAFGSLVDVPTP
jgi:hypothetical protein